MAVQKQDDQHEHTFSNYVRIRDVVQKTYLGWWTVGRSGERGSGISGLPARYDDDEVLLYNINSFICNVLNVFKCCYLILIMFTHSKMVSIVGNDRIYSINRLSVIWKSELIDKMKRNFFQAAVVLILPYECTTWTLTKRMEKKLDGNYTRMLRAIINKSWKQYPTKKQLYGHKPSITKTIKNRRTRHAGTLLEK